MSDETSTDTDNADAESPLSRLKTLWSDNWSALFKGLVISILLHLLVALPVLFHPALPGDFDIEWEGRMAELSQIGHGVDDFDDTEDVDWDEMSHVDTTTDDDEPDDEQTGDDEDPEEESTDDESQDETDDEPQDDPDEAPPDDDPAADDEPEPGPDPDSDDDDDPTDSDDTEPQDDPETDDTAVEYADEPTDIPGLERSGPSNLPELRDYAPGNARLTSLVRTDRLRDTELEPYVNDVIRAIPDYRIALDGTDLDPINDLDSLFMATANPQQLQATFLAARHRMDDEELRDTLDSRYDDSMSWADNDGRPTRRLVPESAGYQEPRQLLLAEPGLALVGQPHWFDELIGAVDEDSDLGRRLADADQGPDAHTLLDGLARIEDAVEGDDTLLVISAYGGRLRAIPGVDVSGLPRFEGVRLALSNADDPTLTIDLRMADSDDARHFERECERVQDELTQPIGLLSVLGLTHIVDRLHCRRDGEYVVVEGQYSGRELRDLLERLVPFIKNSQPPPVRNLPPGPHNQQADDEPETPPHDEQTDEPDDASADEPPTDGNDEDDEKDDGDAEDERDRDNEPNEDRGNDERDRDDEPNEDRGDDERDEAPQ